MSSPQDRSVLKKMLLTASGGVGMYVEALVVATLESTPKGATHWSTRSMADKMGISNSSVGRIWRALGLKPHRSETFQLSTDSLFVEKVRDVVGL
jgi:hypothetical protein